MAEQIERDEVRWFPIDKALCITEQTEDENEIEILYQLTKIEAEVGFFWLIM